MRTHRGLASWVAAVTMASSVVSAQLPAAPAVQPPSAGTSFERISLTAGRSHVLMTDYDVTRLAVTNPTIADATAVTSREILIDSKGPGITSLILWGADRRVQYDVVVDGGTPPLQAQMQAVFPGEDIHVSSTEESVVLSGHVSTNEVALRAAEIAQASFSTLKIINMLQRPGGADSQQVMLEVRFAEVERRTLLEVGVSLLRAKQGGDLGRLTTQQFSAPTVDSQQTGNNLIQVPDFLNIFYFLNSEGLAAAIRALKQRGAFQSLAEPNLLAYNGQEASFLAGGEFPIPLVQGNSGQVTVQFKEFGVRLTFTPRISGEVIRLRVRPEVSTLDFANGLSLAGFRVPALKTRRADTEVELRDGQSFAIAGLLNNESSEDRQAIPLLSSLPIVGHLFKSKAESATRTELLVLITPHLVRPLEPTEVPAMPVDPKSFIKPGNGLGGLLEGGGGLVDGPSPKPAVKERKP